MRIPLPKMMRHWREREFERNLAPQGMRRGLALWAWGAQRPGLYRLGARIATSALKAMGKGGRIRSLPMGHAWTDERDFPAPEGGTFLSKWNPDPEGRRR